MLVTSSYFLLDSSALLHCILIYYYILIFKVQQFTILLQTKVDNKYKSGDLQIIIIRSDSAFDISKVGFYLGNLLQPLMLTVSNLHRMIIIFSNIKSKDEFNHSKF